MVFKSAGTSGFLFFWPQGPEDEPPPVIPRKPEAKRESMSVPNTYVRAPQKKTKGRGS